MQIGLCFSGASSLSGGCSEFVSSGQTLFLYPYHPHVNHIIFKPSYWMPQTQPFSRNLDNSGWVKSTSTQSLVYCPRSTLAVVLSTFSTCPIFYPILYIKNFLLEYSTLSFGIWTQAVSLVILSSSGIKLGIHSQMTR